MSIFFTGVVLFPYISEKLRGENFMTVAALKDKLLLKTLVGSEDLNKGVKGCYVGDLLSWVLSKIKSEDVWVTVMGNVNSIAVAKLTDAACIILAENSPLDEEAKVKAEQQGVVVLSTDKNSYETAVLISRIIE